MKKIEAIIKRDKLSFVRRGLADAGFTALTTYEVTGRGKQSAPISIPGATTIYADPLPKQKIDIIVKDDELERALEVIIAKARTGEIGDGKIFISDVLDVVRIRDGIRGEDTI